MEEKWWKLHCIGKRGIRDGENYTWNPKEEGWMCEVCDKCLKLREELE